jgi:exoribonuclease II
MASAMALRCGAAKPQLAFLSPAPFLCVAHPAFLGAAVCRRASLSPPFPRDSRRRVHVTVIAAAAAPESGVLQAGVVVEYIAPSGKHVLGRALRPDGKKNWIIVGQNGAPQSVSPKQVSYVLGDLTNFARGAAAAGKGKDADGLVASIDVECGALLVEGEELLEMAWEMFLSRDADEGGPVTSLSEITDILFADVPSRTIALYTAHVMLARDRFFFKSKMIKGTTIYEAKAANLVIETRAAILAEEKAAADEQSIREAINESVATRDVSRLRSQVGQETFDLMVSSLEAAALDFGVDRICETNYDVNPDGGFSTLAPAGKAAVKRVLGALGKSVLPAAAFDVLVAWRVFVRHENLALRRAGVHTTMTFSSSALALADELCSAEEVFDLDAGIRRDFGNLVSYAVDSADTTEVDDAIAWDAGDHRVWVHIADPTRYFPAGKDDALVVEALRRGTTLYLPTVRFTMFPARLAEQMLSLGGKKSDNSALSFGFKVADDGDIVKDSVIITTSLIRPPLRLTYSEVDVIMADPTQQDSDIATLTRLAEKRLAWREEQGAVIVHSDFSRVWVKNADQEEPKVSVGITETATRSWTLVSEMMITACGIAGDFGDEASIPLPYRGQDPFEYPTEEAIAAIPAGPARAAAVFKEATPSMVVSEPVEHASI